MKLFNLFILILLLLTSNLSFSKSMSGVVKFEGKDPKGTLYIFAKKYNGSMPMPLAVKKIPGPKFPVSFKLSAADKMMPSLPFKGPFKIIARLSPSGNAMDKSGPEVSTTKKVELGQEGIQLILK